MSSERYRGHLHIDKSGGIVFAPSLTRAGDQGRYSIPELPGSAQVIHVDIDTTGPVEESRVLFISGIHPIEWGADRISQILLRVHYQQSNLVHTRVTNPHNRAALQHGRGYIDSETGEEHNLNRKYPGIVQPSDFAEVYAQVSYPEAQLLLHVLEKRRDLRVLFSFHEDNDRGGEDGGGERKGRISKTDGFYLYDTCFDARTDADIRLIMRLKRHLNQALMDAGFDIFDGVDDPTDPELGYRAKRGLIYQPRINSEGKRVKDSSFEGVAVELGASGLIKLARSFVFEIPMQLSNPRKRKIISIIIKEFIDPYLTAKEILTLTRNDVVRD